MTPRRRVLACVAGLLALAGCSTQRRLFLMSPFGNDEPPSPDRVNLWPLLYKDRDRTSVLWPIFDADDRGWSFRPFVSKDGKNLDILWPLAHADLESGDFWAIVAYRNGEDAGVFPLAGWDAKAGTWRILVAYHGERNDGLFPVVGWGDVDYVGPFWRAGGDQRQYSVGGIFPLVWVTRDADAVVVFPLYAQFGDRQKFFAFSLLPTVFWSNDEKKQQSASMVFPLWWSTTEGTKRRIVTPLGGRGWDSSGADGFVNVLGPLFHYDATGETSFAAFLWPIFEFEHQPVGNSWRVWPLFSHSPFAAKKSPLDYVTLAEHRNDDVETLFRLFPLYSGRHGGAVSSDELLLGLERRYVREDPAAAAGDGGSGSVAQAWRLWPLFSTTNRDSLNDWVDAITLVGWHPHPLRTHWHAGTCLLAGYDSSSEPDSYEARILGATTFGRETFRCETHEGTQTTVRSYAGSVFEWGLAETKEVTEPDGAQHVDVHHRVPLLWEYECDRKKKEWDVLLWCVSSRESANEDEFHVLWKFYETERHGDRVSRNLFPFITYDTAPDESHFSFVWRLWHYERKGEKSGGHILFIPWGDSIE